MENELLQRYISGNATLEEKQAFLCWVEADEQHMQEYKDYRKLYDMQLWNTVIIEAKQKKTFQINRYVRELIKIAAIFVISFTLAYTLFNLPDKKEIVWQTLHVPAGQRAELLLADGTKVWLHAMTTLTFPTQFEEGKREVTLDGEGYFDVTKDEMNPFIVKTELHDVKVFGTEFNTTAYKHANIFTTSLLEGKVDVIAKETGQTIHLEPGECAYSVNGKLHERAIAHADYFRWREGLLCFNNLRMDLLLDRLQLCYAIKIEIQNKKILKNYYTGKFRTKDGIEHVLRVLQLHNNFQFTKDEETNIIYIK